MKFYFIQCVCWLRWMCCGGGVAWNVECTNVVKKWEGVIVTTRTVKGAEVGFSNSRVKTLLPACYVLWYAFNYGITILREKKSQQNSNICTRRGLLTLSLTRTCGVWPPPPVSPKHVLCCLSCVWGPHVCCANHLHRSWVCNSLTERGLGRSVHAVVSPQSTSCKGPVVQSHPLPLSFWLTTCTSGRVEKMREGGGGPKNIVDGRKQCGWKYLWLIDVAFITS